MSDASRAIKPVLMAAALAAVVPSLSSAQGPGPQRRPGLWESTVTLQGAPAVTTGMCTDEAFERRMALVSPSQLGARDCPNLTPMPIPGGYRIEGTCTSNGRTTTIKATAKGDFNRAYTMDVDVEANGKPRSMHMDVRWTGPCGDGVKPGDMVMTVNGRRMVVNVNALAAGGALGAR